jgi:hypothetical protein
MEIYRAVEPGTWEKEYRWRDGTRLPSNVPYLVDNLWEFTRPPDKPSRRRAIYASPTAELAVDGACGPGRTRDMFAAYRLTFRKPPNAFQLSVPDARLHRDVGKLQKQANEQLKALGFDGKLALAPLFLPGTTKKELQDAMDNNLQLRTLVDALAAMVTMWTDVPDPEKGEIIFEIDRDNTYALEPV